MAELSMAQRLRAQADPELLAYIEGIADPRTQDRRNLLSPSTDADLSLPEWYSRHYGPGAGMAVGVADAVVDAVAPWRTGARAGEAVANAIDDPTLANLTGAAVHAGAGLAPFAPKPGLSLMIGGGGTGLAEALRRDVMGPGEAQAQGAPRAPELEALEEQARQLEQKGRDDVPGRPRTEADRIRAEARAQAAAVRQRIADLLADQARSSDQQQRADYDATVTNARAVRDRELAKDHKFADSELGKVYKATGGWAPFIAGGLAGAAERALAAKALSQGPQGFRQLYLYPGLAGGLAGLGTANAPVVYNRQFAPVENPERRAFERYAYELPEGHPDKQRAADYAQRQDKINPVWEGAKPDIWQSLMGVGEGVGGGLFGSALTSVLPAVTRTTTEGAVSMPGRLRAAYHRSQAGGDVARAEREALTRPLASGRQQDVATRQQAADAQQLERAATSPAPPAGPGTSGPPSQSAPTLAERLRQGRAQLEAPQPPRASASNPEPSLPPLRSTQQSLTEAEQLAKRAQGKGRTATEQMSKELPRRVKSDKDGRVRWHEPDSGRFTKDPKKPDSE